MRKVITILTAVLIAGTSQAALDWDIYSDETISEGDYGNINVYDSLDDPPIQTTVDMTGGAVFFFNSHNSSIINVGGGSINTFTALDSSTVNLTGGILNTLDASGAEAYFNIYGYDFTIEQPSSTYLLRGSWVDGTEFEVWLRRADIYGDHYILHEIPEPSVLLIFGIGILFLRKVRNSKD